MRWIGKESTLFDNESVRLRVELHLTVCQDKGDEKFPPDPQTGFIVARLEEDSKNNSESHDIKMHQLDHNLHLKSHVLRMIHGWNP